jgi:hypothetical protein
MPEACSTTRRLGWGTEPLIGRVAFHDLDVNARSGAIRYGRALEPLISQRLAHRPGVRGDLFQQGDPGRVLVRRRGQDDDGHDQSQDIHGQAPLPAGHLLACIFPGPSRRDRRCRVHAPGIQHDQARVGLAALFLPRVPAQQVMDGLIGALIAPPW